MKKILVFISTSILITLLSSCDLFWPIQGDQYFWSLVDQYNELNDGVENEEDKEPLTIRIGSNVTFVMTRGKYDAESEIPGYPSEAEAEGDLNTTEFNLIDVNNDGLQIATGATSKEVRELNTNDFHICQNFTITSIEKNKEYSILGRTKDTSSSPWQEEAQIKVIFE